MRKVLICFSLIVFMIGGYVGCTNSTQIPNYTNLKLEEKEEIIRDINTVKDISTDEKERIAKDLYENYLNNNRTDWKLVKAENLNRDPVVSMTDYNINTVELVSEDKNKFTVDISYDIKYTENSNMWIAGNGTLSDNTWIKNKITFVDIEKYLEHYIITNIYTG